MSQLNVNHLSVRYRGSRGKGREVTGAGAGHRVGTSPDAADPRADAAPGIDADADAVVRDLSLVLFTVLGPKADAPTSPHAQVKVDGAWLDVDGTPDDWTRGPWPHPTAGVSVMLRRADG